MRYRTRTSILLGGVACLLLATVAAAASATPLAGSGMWVWMVSESGASPERIAEVARRRSLDVVLVKAGDGANRWSQFSPELVEALHGAGVDVCAWHFVYGARPRAEARVSAAAKTAGADCLVIDAEAQYEGRYAAADRYITRLRRLVGGSYPVALSSFPYVDYHPAFPYSVFLRPGGADYNMPQIYWLAIGDRLGASFKHTYAWNRLYQRPMFPIGQTWMDPSRKQIRRFRRLALALGAQGVSWWSWQETSRREWRAVSGHSLRPATAPRIQPPTLGRGSEGDPVILVQQLLLAAGIGVPVSGRYGSQTAEAVVEFQLAHALVPTGTVDPPTWARLLEREPVRVRWSKVGSSRGRPVTSGSAPASATLPALRFETGLPSR